MKDTKYFYPNKRLLDYFEYKTFIILSIYFRIEILVEHDSGLTILEEAVKDFETIHFNKNKKIDLPHDAARFKILNTPNQYALEYFIQIMQNIDLLEKISKYFLTKHEDLNNNLLTPSIINDIGNYAELQLIEKESIQ